MERIHKNSIIGSFNNVFSGLGWHIDLPQLVEEFFLTEVWPIKLKVVKELINYFVDAISPGRYLELKALLAATLLDTIAAKYAARQCQSHVMEKKDFRKLLREFKKTVDGTKLDSEVKEQLKDNLVGVYRRSFGKRLELLS